MRILILLLMLVPGFLFGQQEPIDLAGSWQADTPDGPQTIVVRSDSTANFGEETVRWRIKSDTIFVLLGDEWLGYNFELDGDSLTLSGGDLLDPVILRRIGPPPPTGGRAAGGSTRRV